MSREANTYHCIVTRSGPGPLALVKEAGSLRLPTVTLTDERWPPEQAAEINGQLMDRHGLNCTLLQWLDNGGKANLFVLEWHPGAAAPEVDIEWVNPAADTLPLPPDELAMARNWLRSGAERLAPWERPGWMKEAVLWLMGAFDGVNRPRLTNLAQIKAGWGMSTLLLVETTQGDYYFKAGTPQGVEEWKILERLHRTFPGRVAAPEAVREEHGWMILRALEHRPYPPLDHEGLGRAFRAYAEVQLGCADWHRDGALPGLRVRDTAWLHSHVDDFFSDSGPATALSGLKSRLETGELAQLETAWRERIDALDRSALPLTLNQEDLHFDNILNTASGPVVIDWADCAMAHPLFSLHRILSLWGAELSEIDRQEREQVRRAYLDAFSSLIDGNQLEREIAMTGRLANLYQAFRWMETSQRQRGESYWSSKCRDNAVRFMNEAMETADTSREA